jgi:hypothetical protein
MALSITFLSAQLIGDFGPCSRSAGLSIMRGKFRMSDQNQRTINPRDQELACQAGIIPSWGIYPAVLRAFATARREERERCAKIAREFAWPGGMSDLMVLLRNRIAAEIARG